MSKCTLKCEYNETTKPQRTSFEEEHMIELKPNLNQERFEFRVKRSRNLLGPKLILKNILRAKIDDKAESHM